MGAWSRLKARLGQLGRSIHQSEQHLGALPQIAARMPGIEHQLNRIATALESNARHSFLVSQMQARAEIREILADPRLDDPRRLERHGFKIHSQYDEDGIIDEIFRRIGTTNRQCIEFGAGNGTENCTGFLLMQGWKTLWMDGSDEFLPTVKISWKPELERGLLTARQTFITADNIDDLIRDAGFSGEIDLLAVDLDGNDYHVLQAVSAVTPRVICAEYNANIPPPLEWKMARKDDYMWEGLDDRTGASLKALEVMLGERGYALVGCSLGGVNSFFVRKDLVGDKFADPFTAENHYHQWRFFYPAASSISNWREGWAQRR